MSSWTKGGKESGGKESLLVLVTAIFALGIGMWALPEAAIHGRVMYKSSVDQPDVGIGVLVVAVRDSRISQAGGRRVVSFDSQAKVVKDRSIVARTQSDKTGAYSLWVEPGRYYVCLAKEEVEITGLELVGCKRTLVEEPKKNQVDLRLQFGRVISGNRE